jgi:type VI secretion system protein VasD
MNFASRLPHLVCVAALLAFTACAKPPPPPPKPTVIQVSIEAQANVNPDSRGRPSPIVIRFYELKSLATFNAADFFSLYERDKETLGADVLAREEFQLLPGDKRQFQRPTQADTRFVAVVAAFRDLERAQWRAASAVALNQITPVVIKLDGSKISAGAS